MLIVRGFEIETVVVAAGTSRRTQCYTQEFRGEEARGAPGGQTHQPRNLSQPSQLLSQPPSHFGPHQLIFCRSSISQASQLPSHDQSQPEGRTCNFRQTRAPSVMLVMLVMLVMFVDESESSDGSFQPLAVESIAKTTSSTRLELNIGALFCLCERVTVRT